MNTFDNPHDQPRRWGGIAVVGALHVFLAWALVSGTAHHGLTLLKKTLAAEMIQEVHIAPPPPPPPPPKAVPRPRPATVPPPYVPPPDVPVASTGPAIESSALVPHEPPPAPTHAVTVAAGPPSPPAPAAQPQRRDISLVCPTQVAPEMPRRALLDGVEGVVRAQATIQDGVVREVNILSGPRVFYSAVRNAMLQYKCEREGNVVVATQEFNFRLE